MTRFTARLANFHSTLWTYHVAVPIDLALPLIEGEDRRVICTFQDSITVHAGLMPNGEGGFFITVNKDIRTRLHLEVGDELTVALEKDRSDYGMAMPEELEVLLAQDETGNRLFHALPPGKQRTLIFIVAKYKQTDTRIRKALIIVEHLKMNKGKVNYPKLGEEMKGK